MEKYFGYRPPQSDPVVIRQAESARRLRRASAAPQQCSRNAASTSSAEGCPLAASLNLAEIRSMIDLLRVATVLVSHCVRKQTRTSATQTSLRQREARPAAPRSSSLSENICSLQRRSDAVCADQEDRVYPVVCVRREGWSSPLVLNYADRPPEPDAIREGEEQLHGSAGRDQGDRQVRQACVSGLGCEPPSGTEAHACRKTLERSPGA